MDSALDLSIPNALSASDIAIASLDSPMHDLTWV